MIPKNIANEYEQLKNEVLTHNYKYFVLANPVISDEEYDKLFKRLVEIEALYPQIKSPDSPSFRVGSAAVSGFAKVPHSMPMLSLDNTYNDEDIKAFNDRVLKGLDGQAPEYLCELKIDGVSISLSYEKGILVQALTRGDGITGEDVTMNIKTLHSIPLKLNTDLDLQIRGEVYMPNREFERINNERDALGLAIFANPRNATAGTLKLLDSKEVAKRRLSSFMYYIIDPSALKIETQLQALEYLDKIGFSVNKEYMLAKTIDCVTEYWKKWDTQRKSLPYETDGIVVKVNSFAKQQILGQTIRSPRWAIAYKYTSEKKITRVTKISLQVGSTGIITPVAELEPVQLEGTTVKRASLHNFEYIAERDIMENDYVLVEKAGGIIPQVIRPIPEKRTGQEKKVLYPLSCPVCGYTTGKLSPQEVAVRCLNPLCPEKTVRSIENFVSKDAMNIDGMGPKIIERLTQAGYIKDISDIYYLDELKIASLGSGIGIKTITNLMDQIEKSKSSSLERLLCGLGIPLVGKKTARDLAINFKDLRVIAKSSIHELTNLEGIGEDMARSILSFFSSQASFVLLEKLEKAGVNFIYKQEKVSDVLKDIIVSVTGELIRFKRKEFEKYVHERGGVFSDNLTKKTKILVIGQNPSSKAEKAKIWLIPSMSEEEFFEKYR